MSAPGLPEFAKPENNRYPGYRLGYPEEGRGSMGGFLRRLGGLFADWFIALGIAQLFFGADPWAIALLFVAMTSLGIMLFGGSIGHLVFGLRVTRLDGSNTGIWRALARQALIMLVLPPLVWDTDHRGGHDIITGLAVRKR